MTITRSGGSISLEGAFFDVNYAGTVSGSDFSATGVRRCKEEGGRARTALRSSRRQASRVFSGRIVGGDQSLTATEVNSYRLTSGEPVTYTWDWQATRRN